MNTEQVSRDEISVLSLQVSASFNYNNAARVVVSTTLGRVPEVGFVLSALVNIFWPSPDQDVWSEIKEKVEALVDQKISNLVYQQVKEGLDGLEANVNEYLVALKYSSGNPTYISEKYNVALGHFIQELPHFKSSGYETLLLPLFAQFANLHLSLLRDGVLYGKNWGWTQEIQDYNRKRLTRLSNLTLVTPRAFIRKG